ncbi:centrosome-associated protein CEP250 [Eublepharis macularius]|uniref:Centrosome-associated protein CEP250 n=1 Tax=Eublepharis macularius TaxID=481883 RepID=A0AA97KKK4_EUBMA|nr:centrosome-associated protein CEP250 [Eublepharis macularius]
MLVQRKNGHEGLPSRFSGSRRCLQCGSGTESPSLSCKDPEISRRNRQSFATTALKWRSMNKFLFPAKGIANGAPGSLEPECLRRPGREFDGESLSPKHPHRSRSTSSQRSSRFRDSRIGLSTDVESSEGPSHLTLGWRHPVSRLPSHDSGAFGPLQPSARRRRSVSEQDLRASLPERVHKEAELAAFLREADHMPRGEIKELRKLEIDLNVMRFELLSLKQRMESSFFLLEKEKMWLEMMSSADRKRKWEREYKMFSLKMELLKPKSYSGKRRYRLLSRDSGKNENMGKKDIGQHVPALQETLVAQENCMNPLHEEQKETAQQLKPAKEEENLLPTQVIGLEGEVDEASPKPNRVLSDRECLLQVQMLPLELECMQKKQEDDWPLDLSADCVEAESLVSQQDPEKVLLKGELKSARQVNEELSLEVAESRQSLEASLDSLHRLEAEKENLEARIQDLESERAQLLREREGSPREGPANGASQHEEVEALQETCTNLRESQCFLKREKDISETRCLELEAALRGKQEEMEKHLAEQKQVSQYWQDRWDQVATALKAKEEELEKTHVQSQASSAELETPLLLQMQLDACKQELELERNRSQALQQHVQQLQSGSQTFAVPTNETAPQKVDAEVVQVREELQKVWDMLKSRDTELEGQQLELESIRSQCAECRSEKQHLDRIVASLEEQLAEKEQALKRLEEAENVSRTEKEMKISALERKLAEIEAVQDLPGLGSHNAPETREMGKNGTGKDEESQGRCSRRSTAPAQLNEVIQSAEKQDEEELTLGGLNQAKDLLKGSVSDQPPVPRPEQSPSPDTAVKVIPSPQEEKEILKWRHQLVTEQLKGLFKQRQQQEQSKKQLGRSKEERSQAPRKPQEAVPESARPSEGQSADPDMPSSSAEVQRLQRLLKEKMETISSMASEIQALQQKNESLMKAKLRFQQQIQQIRNLPKQRPEKSNAELLVPRLSASLGQDVHSAEGSDSSVPSPQSDEPPFTGSREDLRKALDLPHQHVGAEDRKGSTSDESTCQRHFSALPSAQSRPPAVPSAKPKLELVLPLQADSEGSLLSPRGSALLSPRPFGPPRPWSPFKFKGSPDIPEDREKH